MRRTINANADLGPEMGMDGGLNQLFCSGLFLMCFWFLSPPTVLCIFIKMADSGLDRVPSVLSINLYTSTLSLFDR